MQRHGGAGAVSPRELTQAFHRLGRLFTAAHSTVARAAGGGGSVGAVRIGRAGLGWAGLAGSIVALLWACVV